MGSVKQAMLEEQGVQDARMQQDDWPKCIRCTDPIDFDLVEQEDGKPVDWPSSCSYCRHVAESD